MKHIDARFLVVAAVLGMGGVIFFLLTWMPAPPLPFTP